MDPVDASGNRPLICLSRFSELEARYDKDEAALDNILRELASALPQALQHPGSASVRILIMPVSFESPGFRETRWRYISDIEAFGERAGTLEVCYDSRFPDAHEGPFTADEVMLFEYVTVRIGRIIERLRTRKRLETEGRALKNTNIALNELLSRIRSEQSEVGAFIQANVTRVILPLLYNLSQNSPKEQRGLVELVIESLGNITSPYISRLSERFMSLTPQEVLICHMIRNGFSSKEIAAMKDLSVTTVNTHRENIRRKLKLNNSKVNLKSYLINSMDEQGGLRR